MRTSMMGPLVFVGDLVEANGKTVKQNNLELQHNIPLGTLVEINADPTYPDDRDGLRLFVVTQGRDCDGTPLYWLSHDKYAKIKLHKLEHELPQYDPGSTEHYLCNLAIWGNKSTIIGGYPEDGLTVISPPVFHKRQDEEGE